MTNKIQKKIKIPGADEDAEQWERSYVADRNINGTAALENY